MSIFLERCQPVDFDAKPLRPEVVASLMVYIPGWEIIKCETGDRLSKSFPFEDWPTAIEFLSRLAEQATFENHHPVLTITLGRVTADWWTHSIYGLHRNDFVMACRTDHLFANSLPGSDA